MDSPWLCYVYTHKNKITNFLNIFFSSFLKSSTVSKSTEARVQIAIEIQLLPLILNLFLSVFFSSFNLNTNKVTKTSTEFFFILERFYLVFHIVKLKKKLLILQHRTDSAPVRVRVLGIIARVEKNSSYMAAVEFFTQ